MRVAVKIVLIALVVGIETSCNFFVEPETVQIEEIHHITLDRVPVVLSDGSLKHNGETYTEIQFTMTLASDDQVGRKLKLDARCFTLNDFEGFPVYHLDDRKWPEIDSLIDPHTQLPLEIYWVFNRKIEIPESGFKISYLDECMNGKL